MPIERDFPLSRIDFEELRLKNPNRLETDETWAKELGLRQQDDDWDWDREIPVIFVSESKYTPASGVHRLLGRYLAGFDSYPQVQVCTGTKEDFLRTAIASNKDDNERKVLSREDKRKVLKEIFESLEFWGKSIDTIVRMTGFARSFVYKVREEFLQEIKESDPKRATFLEQTYEKSKETRTVTREGRQYQSNTSNVGKTKQTKSPPATEVKAEVTTVESSVPEISELDKLIEQIAAKEGVAVEKLLSKEYWIPRYAELLGLKTRKVDVIAQPEEKVWVGIPQLFPIKNDPETQVRIEPGDTLIFKEGQVFFDLYEDGKGVALETAGITGVV